MAAIHRMRALNAWDHEHRVSERVWEHPHLKAMGRNLQTIDFGRDLGYYAPLDYVLRSSMPNLRKKTIAHLASGPGVYPYYLQEEHGAQAYALDRNPLAIEVSKMIGNRRALLHDATKKLPFEDGTVDAAISDHFLFTGYPDLEVGDKHIFTDKWPHTASHQVLQNVHRALRPGGVVVVGGHLLSGPGKWWDDPALKKIGESGFNIVNWGEWANIPVLALWKRKPGDNTPEMRL